jgi:predicted flap endonuclease-1-like 5' DNA nuclease
MTVEMILAGIVGLVAGVLAALWWDSQTLVRRVQEANGEKQKAQDSLQKFQIQHNAAVQKLQVASTELATAVAERTQHEETIARQLAEIEASREQLQIGIQTNDQLKQNLQEVQDRVEELEGLRVMAEEKLATAVTENSRLLGDVQLMEAEISTLEAKKEELAQALAQFQGQIADLEQKQMVVEAQLSAMEADKDIAQAQLQQAELTNVEQNAKIEALQQQIKKAEKVQQKLVTAKKKLQTADAHIQKLQDTVEDVQVKMNYTGKSELQLIRGIGPAYARRLNEFGIQSFSDLADCKPEQIADIIKKKSWQAANIQLWIDEAKALAARLGPDA